MNSNSPTPEETEKPKKQKGTLERDGFGAVVLRSIDDIIYDLSQPVRKQHLQTKKQGSSTLTFISWYYAVKYLDRFAPGWNYEVAYAGGQGGKVFVKATISIPCREGVVTRSALGQETEAVKAYGDSTSNAESMALRRAAAKFGLGLYLYYEDAD